MKKTGKILVTATSVAAPASSRSVYVLVSDFVSLTGITVSPATAQFKVYGTQQLTVGYTPADATNMRRTGEFPGTAATRALPRWMRRVW